MLLLIMLVRSSVKIVFIQLVCCPSAWNCRTRKDKSVFLQKMLLPNKKALMRLLENFSSRKFYCIASVIWGYRDDIDLDILFWNQIQTLGINLKSLIFFFFHGPCFCQCLCCNLWLNFAAVSAFPTFTKQ